VERLDLQQQPLAGISFVIPCYRESPEVLQRTIHGIRAGMRKCPGLPYELIVVDDGSGRNLYTTVEGVDHLIVHPVNRGYGGSLKTGIAAACFPWIAITDADDTYPNEEFPRLIEQAGTYQMVIGARPWGSISPIRRMPKRLITKLAAAIAGRNIPDLNSGMRVFHRCIYEQRRNVFPDAFSFSSTLTMVSLTQHFNTVFVPITYGKRTGTSKIRPFRDTTRFTIQILRLSLYFRPLRFFLPLSAVLVLLAVIRGIRDVYVSNQFGGLCLVLFFMSFQVFFFGLIAEIINKKD
jgi:glycosyltransferase involved in cell wall biosynthesis